MGRPCPQRGQLLTHAPHRRPRSCGDMQAPVMPRLWLIILAQQIEGGMT